MPIQNSRAKPFLNRNKFVFSSLCEIRVCHLPQDNLQSWRDQALPLPTCLPPSTPSTLLSPICLQRRRFQSSTLGAVYHSVHVGVPIDLHFKCSVEPIRLESSPDLWPQFINNYDRSLNFSSMRLMWLRFIDYFRRKRRQSATCLDVRQYRERDPLQRTLAVELF